MKTEGSLRGRRLGFSGDGAAEPGCRIVNTGLDSEGRTPLFMASARGNTEVVERLLSAEGISVNQATTDCGEAHLLTASLAGHTEVVERLLSVEGISVNQATTNDGCTPRLMASSRGNTEVVEWLLNAEGIRVNQAETKYGCTPLYMASQEGHTEVVERLLSAEGVSVNQATTYYGNTPLYVAKTRRITKLLIWNKAHFQNTQLVKDIARYMIETEYPNCFLFCMGCFKAGGAFGRVYEGRVRHRIISFLLPCDKEDIPSRDVKEMFSTVLEKAKKKRTR